MPICSLGVRAILRRNVGGTRFMTPLRGVASRPTGGRRQTEESVG